MSQPIDVHGHCDPRFAAVAKAFEENFRLRDEVGAAVAVTLNNEPVVDLWAGFADQARTRPWQRDTIVNVYSTTKGMTALCAHRSSTRAGSTSTRRWRATGRSSPQNGKEQIPVRWLLEPPLRAAGGARAAARRGALRLGARWRRRSPPRSRGGRRARSTATTP